MSITKSEITLLRIFGERMREIRKISGLSQSEASRLLGTTIKRLNKIENCYDQAHISLKFVKRAAQMFDCSSDYLLGLTTDWDGSDPESRMLDRKISDGVRKFYCDEVSKLIIESNQVHDAVTTALSETTAILLEIQGVVEVDGSLYKRLSSALSMLSCANQKLAPV